MSLEATKKDKLQTITVWIDKEMFYRSIYFKAKPKKAMSILLYLFTATLYREWEGKNKKV